MQHVQARSMSLRWYTSAWPAPCQRPARPAHRRVLCRHAAARIVKAASSASLAAVPGADSGGFAGLRPAAHSHRDPQQRLLEQDHAYVPPPQLPPAPTSAKLMDVLPYLLRMALGERQLYWRLGVALLLLLTSKAAGLMAPVYFKQAVDALSTTASSTATPMAAAGTAAAAAASAAAVALLLSGACRGLSGVAKELQHPAFTPVAQAAGRRISYYTFAHVLGLDLVFHLSRRTGALSRMLERGARSVSMIFRAAVFTFLPTAVELVAVCAILARSFHPRVSLLVVATFAAYAAWTVALTWTATGLRRQVKDLDNKISGKAVDTLLNFETVKLYANENLQVREYDTSLTAYQRASVRMELASAALNAGQAVVLAGGMTAVLLAAAAGPGSAAAAAGAAAGAAAAGITPGDLVMIQGLLLQLWGPLQFLGWFYRELRQSLVDMEDLFSLLATQTSLPDGTKDLPAAPSAGSSTGSSSNGNGALPAAQQQQREQQQQLAERLASGAAASSSSSGANRGLRLEMQDVCFTYKTPLPADKPGSGSSKQGKGASAKWSKYASSASVDQQLVPDSRQVLAGVSLRAEPGESIAVVGPSGSGKSTLLRLLVRLYEAEGGQVLLEGTDVRELRQASLRSAVAVVPQDTVLFNDTILANVAFGRPGATFAEVQAAAAAAKLDEAIARMPAGWDTLVGERGLKLSGGEKQRVAIARAFLRQPRLLICDEATSALDTSTERGIMASLAELAAGRTAVFVAHRLSTIQGCDRIYVLADGVVAEQGTHDQLMSARGLYYDMWQLQAAQEALEDHLPHHHQQQAGSTQQQQQASASQQQQQQQRGEQPAGNGDGTQPAEQQGQQVAGEAGAGDGGLLSADSSFSEEDIEAQQARQQLHVDLN